MTHKQIASLTALLTALGVATAIWSLAAPSVGVTQSSEGEKSPNVSDVDGNVAISN